MNGRRMLLLAISLEIIGLLAGIIPMLELTPATFLVFGTISTPLVLAGMLIYLVYVVQVLRERGAL